MNHYVYYSYEPFGRGYIGCRSCKCDVVNDLYFGSYRDDSFNPSEKIVLQTFDSREEALEAEITLHEFFDVARNPHFANLARQTSTGWSTFGTLRPHTEETRKKMSKVRKQIPSRGMTGKKHSQSTIEKMRDAHRGVHHSKETKKKMSDSHKGKTLSSSHKASLSERFSNRPRLQCPHCDRLIVDYKMTHHISTSHRGE